MGPFARTLVGSSFSIIVLVSGRTFAADAERGSPPAPTCERDSAHGWQGLTVSRDDPAVAAAWSNGSLWITRNDGRHWTRSMHLEHGYVAEAFALSGGRFVVRTGQPTSVRIVEPDGRTVVRAMPFEPTRIAGASATLAALSGGRLATSHDAGRTWRIDDERPTTDDDGTRGGIYGEPFIEIDGTVRVLSVDVNMCASVDRLERVSTHVLHRDAPRAELRDYDLRRMYGGTRYEPGAHGWLYSWSSPRLLAVTRHRALPMRGYQPVLEDAADGYRRSLTVGSNGRITLGVLGRDLVRLDGERARLLASDAPRDVVRVEVDARGRAWLLTERGTVERFSRIDGWTSVLPGCALPFRR